MQALTHSEVSSHSFHFLWLFLTVAALSPSAQSAMQSMQASRLPLMFNIYSNCSDFVAVDLFVLQANNC